MTDSLLKNVSSYYSQKVTEHGLTPKGVDWNSKESQFLRFEKLAECLSKGPKISVLDYGCGTGDFVTFLQSFGFSFEYTGFDVSEDMVELAKTRFDQSNVRFTSTKPEQKYDFVIASGIFNVKLTHTNDEWRTYIEQTIESFNALSVKGFSFNILTSYSDADKQRLDLFYADPNYYFDICKKRYSRFVSLIHDYPLYEFTIKVIK